MLRDGSKLSTVIKIVRAVIMFLFAWVLSGCMTHPVKIRAANDFRCPEESVEVESVGGSGWRATGCGQTATYVCQQNGSSEFNQACRRESR